MLECRTQCPLGIAYCVYVDNCLPAVVQLKQHIFWYFEYVFRRDLELAKMCRELEGKHPGGKQRKAIQKKYAHYGFLAPKRPQMKRLLSHEILTLILDGVECFTEYQHSQGRIPDIPLMGCHLHFEEEGFPAPVVSRSEQIRMKAEFLLKVSGVKRIEYRFSGNVSRALGLFLYDERLRMDIPAHSPLAMWIDRVDLPPLVGNHKKNLSSYLASTEQNVKFLEKSGYSRKT